MNRADIPGPTGAPRHAAPATPRRESGSASVLVAAASVVILVLALAAALVVAAAQAATVARTAADLGALAGAGAQVRQLSGDPSGQPPCVAAAEVVQANGASLTTCTIDHGVNVTIHVAVPLQRRLASAAGRSTATASARAGPADPGPPPPQLAEPGPGR